MGKVLVENKKSVKAPEKAKKKKVKKIDYSYPKITPREKPIHLQYSLGGICASLKNSQQIIPGNLKLLNKLDRINTMIAGMENQGEHFHDQVQQLRSEFQEIKERLVSSEEKAMKNWLIQCERYKRWLEKVTGPFRIWMDDLSVKHGLTFPVGHIQMKIRFYFPNLKRRDGPNKEQAIFDMLKAVKFVVDDQWTSIDECSWKCSPYGPRPRTDIYITIVDRHRSLWSDFLIDKPRRRNMRKSSLGGMVISELDTELK